MSHPIPSHPIPNHPMPKRRLLPALLLPALLLAATAGCGDLPGSGRGGGGSAAADTAPAPRPDLAADERSTIELFRNASPSVVFITTLEQRRDRFSLNVFERPRGSGTGFIWDRDGHVVTNYHVVAGDGRRPPSRVQVTLADQSDYDARLVGVAPGKDLAVLRIDAPRDRLRTLPLGRSLELAVGQNAYAIGNPFGLDQTLTTGVVSALGREIQSRAGLPIRDVVQTDAAINPGNSGGPLLDSAGRLIGVNTAIYSPSGADAGIGFAIPVDTVAWVVPELIANGELRRPTLGIEPANDNVARRAGITGGVLVLGVYRDSGAEEAGVRATVRDRRGRIVLGDVIVAVDGTPILEVADLYLALERREVGEAVELTLQRDGDEVSLAVTLGPAG